MWAEIKYLFPNFNDCTVEVISAYTKIKGAPGIYLNGHFVSLCVLTIVLM